MSRAEKREAARKKREELKKQLWDVIRASVPEGGSKDDLIDGIRTAEAYFAEQIRLRPREKALILDALYEFKDEFTEMLKFAVQGSKEKRHEPSEVTGG